MSTSSPLTHRIALIHATALAVAPIQSAFRQHWPEARLMNVLDDSLSVDRTAAGTLTTAMTQRFLDLASYTQRAGCQAILFTCSAFGPAIEAAGQAVGMPTLKPNEAMFDDALSRSPDQGAKIGLLATFEASIESMSTELMAMAEQLNKTIVVHSVFVPEAMQDLAQGNVDAHHRKIAEAARVLDGCDVVMLAQFSMAAAQATVQAVLQCPVLSSPECAVLALKKQLNTTASEQLIHG
jgi:aspartate/glutamate racemase